MTTMVLPSSPRQHQNQEQHVQHMQHNQHKQQQLLLHMGVQEMAWALCWMGEVNRLLSVTDRQ